MLKVVHYLNQFFGGIGGEDKAEVGPQLHEGAKGPGMAFEKALGDRGKIVATVICGDNYFAENIEGASEEVIALIRPYGPDLFIAGPAFNAGRYGIASGGICGAVIRQLGIPAITGMHQENPGVDLYRPEVYIVPTEGSAKGMNEAVSRMVHLSLKLAADEKIGRPADEGYFPRGLLVNEISEQTGAERVVSMVLNKVKDRSFVTEVPRPKYDLVPPAPAVKDLSKAKIALITDGGLVPRGNPDHIEMMTATRYGKYPLKGTASLNKDDYEVSHVGYDSVFVRQDPNRLVPVDVMRDLDKEGAIGELHEEFYSTAGVANIVETMRKMGQSMAEELKAEGVSGVILTSTWGTSTRCGATLTKELERIGIPTAHVCSIVPVAFMVGSNRVVTGSKIVNPVGNADLNPQEEKGLRRAIVEKALKALETEVGEQTLFEQYNGEGL